MEPHWKRSGRIQDCLERPPRDDGTNGKLPHRPTSLSPTPPTRGLPRQMPTQPQHLPKQEGGRHLVQRTAPGLPMPHGAHCSLTRDQTDKHPNKGFGTGRRYTNPGQPPGTNETTTDGALTTGPNQTNNPVDLTNQSDPPTAHGSHASNHQSDSPNPTSAGTKSTNNNGGHSVTQRELGLDTGRPDHTHTTHCATSKPHTGQSTTHKGPGKQGGHGISTHDPLTRDGPSRPPIQTLPGRRGQVLTRTLPP